MPSEEKTLVPNNKNANELTEDELKEISGGYFIDHKFKVVYYSQSEWSMMSESQKSSMKAFFGGDYKLSVVSDEEYERKTH